MQSTISYQGFLPVRSKPSASAGMISQVLFGESISIIDSEGDWLRIVIDTGHDEAWVERNSLSRAPGETWTENEGQTGEMMVIQAHSKVEDQLYGRQLLLPAGSVMHNEKRFRRLSDKGWIVPGAQIDPNEVGKGLLSIPGLNGGRCGFGLDAPGLAQLLCRSMGFSIPHSISAQAGLGSNVNFIHEVRKGDLAFFHAGEEIITHVGMVLDERRIIHVSDQVRIDRLDQQGIYCDEKENYTHQLSVVKSLKS